jgi:hypothetical protein
MRGGLVLMFFAWGCLSPLAEAVLQPPMDADPEAVAALQHHARVEEWTREMRAQYADNDDVWVAHGIRADRSAKRVELLAEATGLSENHPIEFILIGESSGHDYEALAVSHALPSAVHQALTFIGMPVGAPFNPQALRYFPKGERVLVDMEWTDSGGDTFRWPVTELIMDLRTGEAMVDEGFAFVGSQWVEEAGERGYVADMFDPRSIVSLYNEPGTVLDRPARVPQAAVYGSLQIFPGRQAAYGQLVHIHLRPEFTDGRTRIANVTLQVDVGEDEVPVPLSLLGTAGEPLHEGRGLTAVLASLEGLIEGGQTPCLDLDIAAAVPLAELRDLAMILRRFEEEELIQIEPPASGTLSYRAFVPVESHRQRADRPSQVLELLLEREDEELTATVIEIVDGRRRAEEEFAPEITTYPVGAPAELPAVLAAIDHRLPVLLVFVPTDLTYGEVMRWLGPVLETHSTIYLLSSE